MRTITLALPVFGFIVATRATLGAGIGLLVGDRLPASRRRTVGAALVAIGAAATIPAALWISRSIARPRTRSVVGRDPRLIGATRLARKGDEPI